MKRLLPFFLILTASPARSGLERCAFFENGIQDASSKKYKIQDFKPTLQKCRAPSGEMLIATREFRSENLRYFLTFEHESLAARIISATCLECEATTLHALGDSRFGSAVTRASRDFSVLKRKTYFASAGLKRTENAEIGAVISADLCPSPKPLARDFFNRLAKMQSQAPVALAISGRWLEKHRQDFVWLKGEVEAKRLVITWVNHSFHHPYFQAEPEEHNYLLSPSADLDTEVHRTERLMIENGITPSPFFRFPALISDERLMNAIKFKSLIPVASDAWLSKGQEPKDGSIILVHANGNEPYGIKRFSKLVETKRLPLPLLPLESAPLLPLFNVDGALGAPQSHSAVPLRPQ